MTVVVVVFVVAALALATIDAFQAVTGKRLSKRPSTRSDTQMRRESAIAAVVLIIVSVLALIVVI